MSIKVCWEKDEARNIWCPFTRVGEQASGAAENRPDGSYNCIADHCMAWRWVMTNVTTKTFEGDSLRPSGDTHGYCGLAGKPE